MRCISTFYRSAQRRRQACSIPPEWMLNLSGRAAQSRAEYSLGENFALRLAADIFAPAVRLTGGAPTPVVGQICMKNASTRTERMEAIKGFVCKYGPMDIMTALTITAKFAEYNQVYLPKSKLLRKEVMDILLHMKHFFPFAAALCEAAAQHHTVSTCDSLSRFLS